MYTYKIETTHTLTGVLQIRNSMYGAYIYTMSLESSIAEVPFFASRTVPPLAPVAAILTPLTRAFTPVNQPNAEGLQLCDYRH